MNLKKNYIWHKFSEFANVLIYKEKVAKMTTLQNVAGVAGFEPTNVGTKSRCLTTWRHPIKKIPFKTTPNHFCRQPQ